MANAHCCCLMSCKLSLEKVEKVLKPPQIPVNINHFKLLTSKVLENVLSIQFIIKPISKQASIFDINVAHGNPEE